MKIMPCPLNGPRNISEFVCAGEVVEMPEPNRADDAEWAKSYVADLAAEQEEDGSWFGRWGSNYIYGTWSVLCAFNAVGEDMGALGHQLQCLVVVLDGLREPALFSMHVAPVAIGLGKPRIETDGRIVVFNGPVELAVIKIGVAPADDKGRLIGLQADGFAVIGDGWAELAFPLVGIAPVGEGDGEIVADEPSRLDIAGTGDDADVGMGASGITNEDILGEIRLAGLGPGQ